MSDNLEDENKQLRRQLKAYVANASKNEQKLHRFQQHELRFISTNGLLELLQALFHDYRKDFQLDAITLVLIDPEYEIRRIMDNLSLEQSKFPDLLFTEDNEKLEQLFKYSYSPRLGKCDNGCYANLFPHYTTSPASMAVFPLIRNKQLIGTLNIGSHEEQRYIQGIGTDFLERLAAIVAVCLENAINHEKVKLLGLIDPLTGVHNRRYFDQRLEEEIDRALRQQKPLSCLFLDIDHFKKFNDTYGHHIGDLVLRDVANIIKHQMRMSDVLGRYGGEEFSVLLVQTDTREAMEIAERIRNTIEAHKPLTSDNQLLDVTISIGCSTLPVQFEGGLDAAGHSLLNVADKALYISKEQGRNRVSYLNIFGQPVPATAAMDA